ncbi:MAG: hypothetical protein ACOVN7_03240 [Rubrivivax sp.]|jgi:hypothetical protein
MTVVGLLSLFLLAGALALAAGALSGMRLAAEALGKELAAMMGAFYGPTAVLPATVVGLLILYFAS